jgi:hypothetical protein
MLRKNLKKAIEMFFSIKLSLLVLIVQLLSELMLVGEFIGFGGSYLGIFSNVEPDGASLLRAAINAWIFNLVTIICERIDVSLIKPTRPSRWLIAQNQLEDWIKRRIPSLSLAKLSLEISKVFLLTGLDLYIYYSSDCKYLMGLTNTYSERVWAYSLAKDLFEYSFDNRIEWLFFFNFFDQGKVIERIERRLEDEEIELFIKEQAIDYLNQLGIIHRANLVELSLEQEEEPEHIREKIPRGCYGCKYLYGQLLNGNLLVCAIHPYGLDDCPDLEVIPAIALTHKNCHLPNFYGVRTTRSLEDLKKAIAILQLLRARLPSFETVEDYLYPDTMTELLARLFDCQPIVSPDPFPIVGTIDLSNNRDDSTERERLNQRVARFGAAMRAILEIMYSQALLKADYRDIVLILELMLRGYHVPIEWGLKTPSGEPYAGAISGGDLDDEPDWV